VAGQVIYREVLMDIHGVINKYDELDTSAGHDDVEMNVLKGILTTQFTRLDMIIYFSVWI